MRRMRALGIPITVLSVLTSSGHAQQTAAEQYLFTALNESRIAAGLPALKWSPQLAQSAAVHAEAMQREETVTHQFDREADLPERAAATGARFSVVAENIGVGASAVDLHGMWMRSPEHRDNVLDPSVTAVGVSLRESHGDVWGVEDFAGNVAELPLTEQERRVVALLRAAGVAAASADAARQMCQQTSGVVDQHPLFVMRFNATALDQLPQQLLRRISQDHASQATVGACDHAGQPFASYAVAVALYR